MSCKYKLIFRDKERTRGILGSLTGPKYTGISSIIVNGNFINSKA